MTKRRFKGLRAPEERGGASRMGGAHGDGVISEVLKLDPPHRREIPNTKVVMARQPAAS